MKLYTAVNSLNIIFKHEYPSLLTTDWFYDITCKSYYPTQLRVACVVFTVVTLVQLMERPAPMSSG